MTNASSVSHDSTEGAASGPRLSTPSFNTFCRVTQNLLERNHLHYERPNVPIIENGNGMEALYIGEPEGSWIGKGVAKMRCVGTDALLQELRIALPRVITDTVAVAIRNDNRDWKIPVIVSRVHDGTIGDIQVHAFQVQHLWESECTQKEGLKTILQRLAQCYANELIAQNAQKETDAQMPSWMTSALGVIVGRIEPCLCTANKHTHVLIPVNG